MNFAKLFNKIDEVKETEVIARSEDFFVPLKEILSKNKGILSYQHWYNTYYHDILNLRAIFAKFIFDLNIDRETQRYILSENFLDTFAKFVWENSSKEI